MDFILFEALDEHLLFEASLLDPHVNLKVIVFSKALDKAGQKKKKNEKSSGLPSSFQFNDLRFIDSDGVTKSMLVTCSLSYFVIGSSAVRINVVGRPCQP